MGHDITVLTTKKEKCDVDLALSTNDFNVIDIGDYQPFKKINSIVIQSENSINSAKRNNNIINNVFYKLLKFIKKLYIDFSAKTGCFYTCRFPDWHDLWAKKIISIIKNEYWDVVISTGGPYSVHRVGYWLKRNKKTNYWVIDWRDLWVDNHIFKGIFLFWPYENYLEHKFHKYCDFITTVSEPIADILREKTNKPVYVIYNGFDVDEYKYLPEEPIFPKDDIIRIVYTGTIYKGKRDPSPLFEAINNLYKNNIVTPDKLKIIFAGSNANTLQLAESYGITSFCEFKGIMLREDALRMQRDCDVLLFLEFGSTKIEGILTGKIFEYLFSSKPIWAIGIKENSSAGKIIIETNRGIVLGNDINKIKEEIIKILNNKKTLKNQKQNKSVNEKILFYSREKQADLLLDNIISNFKILQKI